MQRKLGDTAMWDDYKELLTAGMLIWFSVWILFHLVQLWNHGEFLIGESSRPIIAIEIFAVIGILGIAVDRFIAKLRSKS
jgi:hypothetical protein